VRRRPRAVWLLDAPQPTGAAIMALRRVRVLSRALASTPLALSGGSAPVGSPLRGVQPAGGLAGEVRIARADLVVTTSERTLASAAPRLTGHTRLIHFLHARPDDELRSERFLRRIGAASRVIVPPSVDAAAFAAAVGLPSDRVSSMDDFTLPADALLSAAQPDVALAAGRLPAGSAILDLAEAFRLAGPELPGWQLRVAGDGPGRAELEDFVAAHRLRSRLLVLGARHDLAAHYLDAGLVARIEPTDVNGLSVLEALAAGLPVLAADSVPAARRHVRDGVDGRVLGRVDPPALAAALVELSEPGVRAELAAAARTSGRGLLTDAGREELHALFATVLDTDARRHR
jgi:glycosyltransferase involved in cell wall biosynthesis